MSPGLPGLRSAQPGYWVSMSCSVCRRSSSHHTRSNCASFSSADAALSNTCAERKENTRSHFCGFSIPSLITESFKHTRRRRETLMVNPHLPVTQFQQPLALCCPVSQTRHSHFVCCSILKRSHQLYLQTQLWQG